MKDPIPNFFGVTVKCRHTGLFQETSYYHNNVCYVKMENSAQSLTPIFWGDD